MSADLKYRPDIDGLRAIAVGSVVLYHGGVLGMTGGFVGVDVFFVISGFLITSILKRECEADAFSLVGFYERRARRILPALFFMLFVCFGGAWLLYLPEAFDKFAKSALSVVLFASNLWYWRSATDYFAADASADPLLHTWSLGIEEQFYLVFPVLLYFLYRWRTNIPLVIALLTAGSFALSVYGVAAWWNAAFFLPVTRAWELGLGAMLALVAAPGWMNIRWLRELLAAGALIAIAAPLYLLTDHSPFPGVNALGPSVGAAVLIATGGAGPTLVGRLLSLPPMVFLGLISYSLYLWHWPVMSFTSFVIGLYPAFFPPVVKVLVIAGSLILGVLSWRFIERPFRKRAVFDRSRIFAASGVSGAVLAGLLVWVIAGDGLSSRIPAETQTLLASAQRTLPTDCTPHEGGAVCSMNAASGQPVSFVLWGDSHAEALEPAVRYAAEASDRAGEIQALGGCPAILDLLNTNIATDCAARNRALLAEIASDPRADSVVLVGFWKNYVRNANGKFFDVSGGREPFSAEALETGLDAVVAALRKAGKEVYIVADVPEFGWHVPRAVYLSQRFGVPLKPSPDLAGYLAVNQPILDAFERIAQRHDAHVVTLADRMCAPECPWLHDGNLVYEDAHHLSSLVAREWIGPMLATALWQVEVSQLTPGDGVGQPPASTPR